MLLNYPVLSILAMRCTPVFSSFSQFAHEMCSCIFQSYSYRPCDLQCSRTYFQVRVNSSVWLCSDIFRRFRSFNSCVQCSRPCSVRSRVCYSVASVVCLLPASSVRKSIVV